MTKKLLSSIFSLLTFSLFAQLPQVQLGFSLGDGAGGRDEITDLVRDDAGNTYVLGKLRGALDVDPDSGVFVLAPLSTSDDIWVGKYFSDGALAWAFNIGNASIEEAFAIRLDGQGNIYICGYFVNTMDFDPSSSVFELTSTTPSNSDGFFAKYDNDGNFIWVRQIASSVTAFCGDLIIDQDEFIYLTGNFSGTGDLDPGPGQAIFTSTGNNDAFIAKYDINGNYIWGFLLQGSVLPCNGVSLGLTANRDLIASGIFQQTIDLDPSANTANVTSSGNYDVYLARYSPAGNFIWGFKIGGNQVDEVKRINIAPSGDILVAGLFSGTVDFDPSANSSSQSSNGNRDIFVASYSDSGNLNWVKTYGGSSNDEARSVYVDENNNIYVTGYFQNTADFNPGGSSTYTAVGGDIFVLSLSANGNYRWSFPAGGTGFDAGNVVFCHDDKLILGGVYANTVNFNPNGEPQTGSGDLANSFFAEYALSDGNFQNVTVFFDRNGGNDIAEAMAVDANNNIYLAGTFSGEVDFSRNNSLIINSSGATDAFLAKYSSTGLFNWAVRIGNTSIDNGNAVVVDQSGAVYFTGSFQGPVNLNPNGSPAEVTSNGQLDVFLCKYNTNGILEWGFSFGGNSADEGIDIKLDNQGNIVLGGVFRNNANFNPLGPEAANFTANQADAFIAKYNSSNGHLIWVKTFTGNNNEFIRRLVVNEQNEVYVGGNFNSNIDFNDGEPPVQSSNEFDAFLVKLNAGGEVIWKKIIGGQTNEEIRGIALDASNNIYLIGNFNNTMIFETALTTDTLISTGLFDIFIAKLNDNAEHQWAYSIGGNISDSGNNIFFFDDKFYITGNFRNDADFNPAGSPEILNTGGSLNAYLASYDTDAVLQQALLFEGSPGSTGLDLLVNNQHMYSCGSFSGVLDLQPGPAANRINSKGGSDIYFVRFGEGEPCEPIFASITEDVCNSFSINGQTFTQSGIYTQTLITLGGCDSVLTINLTIRNSSTASLVLSDCNSVTVNNQTYSESGNFTQTLINQSGCDSVINIQVTINEATEGFLEFTNCGPILVNNITYDESGIYTQTLMNQAGCDSLLNLDITINTPTEASIALSACETITVNGSTYAESGIYTQTLSNQAGCDSLLTLNITINAPTTFNLNASACAQYVLNGEVYTASGTYTQTLVNQAGCDSIIVLSLSIGGDVIEEVLNVSSCEAFTINEMTYEESGTYTQSFLSPDGCDSLLIINLVINEPTLLNLEQTSCGPFVLNGQLYVESGNYTQTLINLAGCDSTINLQLNIIDLNANVFQVENTLSALPDGLAYSWLNCLSNALVPSETNQSFTATESGQYAAIVSDGICTDTSECVNVTLTGIYALHTESAIRIYPNPGRGQYFVDADLQTTAYPLLIEVLDLKGALVEKYQINNIHEMIRLVANPGFYFCRITDASGAQTNVKLIHQ